MTYFLDLRASNQGGLLAPQITATLDGKPIEVREIAQAARGHDVIFGVHGFNVNRQNGMESLRRLGELINLRDTLFVGVLWPGDSVWAPGLDYPYEAGIAIASGIQLGRYLDLNFGNAVSLSFVSHSLGARVVLEAVRHIRWQMRHLVLMAGAINADCLIKEYSDAAKKVEHISLLASMSDNVLKWAFPPGNFLSGIVTRGHPYCNLALGYEGPDAPTPSNVLGGWQILKEWDFGHGDYLPNQDTATVTTLPPPIPSIDDWKPNWSARFVAVRVGG